MLFFHLEPGLLMPQWGQRGSSTLISFLQLGHKIEFRLRFAITASSENCRNEFSHSALSFTAFKITPILLYEHTLFHRIINKRDDVLPNGRGTVLDVSISCKNLIPLDVVLLPYFAIRAVVVQNGLEAIEGICKS
jgi:hypothetical protein